MAKQGIAAHERRIIRRLEARGEAGLGDALVRLDGAVVGRKFRIESLYAVGSEGAVYLCRDLEDRGAPMRVAKVALLPLHRPFDLTDEELRRRRDCLREEATNLARADSRYMPASLGLFHFANPALESDWGGEFAEPEPCIVMEKIPGFDLDLWLARMHSSRVPKVLLRRQLDHVAVVVLSGLMDLQDKGFFYTDLRPGNVRIRGRSKERVRLLDAGSLVRVDDLSGKFPHVPAYLPPELFETSHAGGVLLPTPAVQAVMAGRTLFEVATGRVPLPGEPVETAALYGLNVSPSIAETIERLCRASFPDVATALAYLSENFRHDAADRAPAQASSSRAAAQAMAREAAESASRDPEDLDYPAPARVPEPTPITFSLPPAKPRLDLHSMLASARSSPAPAKNAPRAGDRPASIVGVRPMRAEDQPTPLMPHSSQASQSRTPSSTVASTASHTAPAAAQRLAALSAAPAATPRVVQAAAAPAPARPAPAPVRPVPPPVRPVPPPVRPLKQAPAIVRDEEPADYEFAAAYAAAVAKGETPPPPATPTKPVTRAAPEASSEPITIEAAGGARPPAPQAAAPAPAARPEPTRSLPPRAEPPSAEPPRPALPRMTTLAPELPKPAAARAEPRPASPPPAAKPAPAAKPVPPPPPPTALPLAQAFAMSPKPVLPPAPGAPEEHDDIPVLQTGRVTQNDDVPVLHTGRVTQDEYHEPTEFPEPRPRAPAPRAAKPSAAKPAPSPAPPTADAEDSVPVVEPVSAEMRSGELRTLRADETADAETILPAVRPKSFFARLVDKLLGRG